MHDVYYDDQQLLGGRYAEINNRSPSSKHDSVYYDQSRNYRDRKRNAPIGSSRSVGYGNPLVEDLFDNSNSRYSHTRLASRNYGGSVLEISPSSCHMNLSGHSPRSLTKQVDQMTYEMPRAHQYAHPSLRSYVPSPNRRGKMATSRAVGGEAPQFLKVFGDIPDALQGARITLDCVLLGMPRPRVVWLFNGVRIGFSDVQIDDTADLCRLTIPRLARHHYGTYTVVAENELGRAVTHATVSPPIGGI